MISSTSETVKFNHFNLGAQKLLSLSKFDVVLDVKILMYRTEHMSLCLRN